MNEREFICEDCGYKIFSVDAQANDNGDVCAVCRYIREHPDMPDEMKKVLRPDTVVKE